MEKLHNFIPVHEVLERARGFHAHAAGLFAQWAAAEAGAPAKGFLTLAAESEQKVAESLARALDGDADVKSTESWFQNPPETIPSLDDLMALHASASNVDAFAAALHSLHARWADIYRALSAGNDAETVSELLDSCHGLVEGLEKHLSAAQVQLRDM